MKKIFPKRCVFLFVTIFSLVFIYLSLFKMAFSNPQSIFGFNNNSFCSPSPCDYENLEDYFNDPNCWESSLEELFYSMLENSFLGFEFEEDPILLSCVETCRLECNLFEYNLVKSACLISCWDECTINLEGWGCEIPGCEAAE